MSDEDIKFKAIINVEESEEVAGLWISPHIPDLGAYKLLAKEKKDGTCEWAHLIERDNGTKKLLFRGATKNREELQKVVDAVNENLANIFGKKVQLGAGKIHTYNVKQFKSGQGWTSDTGEVN